MGEYAEERLAFEHPEVFGQRLRPRRERPLVVVEKDKDGYDFEITIINLND